MAEFAHPSNTFNSYNSSFTSYDDYYILDLSYTEYNRSINQISNYLGIEPENWNGADWALFLINFDYGCMCLGDN